MARWQEGAAGGRVDPVHIWISAPRPSPVMVWTPAQIAVFLKAADRHRLHALWRLIATRGCAAARSAGCAADTDLDVSLVSLPAPEADGPLKPSESG